MKTTISLPDSVFQEAESLAKSLDVSRSELYTKAIADYLKNHSQKLKRLSQKQITQKLNDVYAEEDPILDPVMAKIQFLSLPHEDW